MDKENNILDWLKEELNLNEIQVVVPLTDKEIKKAIKKLIKIPEIKKMFEKIVNKFLERKDYMRKLAFMLECSICNTITTHRFIEIEYIDSNFRLKCMTCECINYILYQEDFNEFYEKGNIGLTELNFKKIY